MIEITYQSHDSEVIMKQKTINNLITATVQDLRSRGSITEAQYQTAIHSKPPHLRLCYCEVCKIDKGW